MGGVNSGGDLYMQGLRYMAKPEVQKQLVQKPTDNGGTQIGFSTEALKKDKDVPQFLKDAANSGADADGNGALSAAELYDHFSPSKGPLQALQPKSLEPISKWQATKDMVKALTPRMPDWRFMAKEAKHTVKDIMTKDVLLIKNALTPTKPEPSPSLRDGVNI